MKLHNDVTGIRKFGSDKTGDIAGIRIANDTCKNGSGIIYVADSGSVKRLIVPTFSRDIYPCPSVGLYWVL